MSSFFINNKETWMRRGDDRSNHGCCNCNGGIQHDKISIAAGRDIDDMAGDLNVDGCNE